MKMDSTIVIKEVEGFCGFENQKKEFKLIVCWCCHDVLKVPYRFCTMCSVGESEESSRLLTEDVLQINQRHVVFMIDEGLRDIFLLHHNLLKDPMDAAANLLTDFFTRLYYFTLLIFV